MPATSKRFLSAYFTLPPSALLTAGSENWKDVFPFTSRHGAWTFSGRVALFAGLQQIQLRRHSTILVPTYFQGTEIDTLLAAEYKVKFYAIHDNFTVDLEDVEEKLDGDVSALYIIHYFGLPQPLKTIEAFCRSKGIALIEDCALSFLSKEGDTWLGSRGDIALFSIYKSVPLPHGGYVVTNNPSESAALYPPPFFSTALQTADLVAQHVRCSSTDGIVNRMWSLTERARRGIANTTVVSGTITLDAKTLRYSAAPIVPRLMRLVDPASVIQQRRANFSRLHNHLRHLSPFSFDTLAEGSCPLFYPIIVKEKRRFRDELASRGVGSVNLWSQPHPASPAEMLPQTIRFRRSILELPIHQQLGEEDIDRVAREVLALSRS